MIEGEEGNVEEEIIEGESGGIREEKNKDMRKEGIENII